MKNGRISRSLVKTPAVNKRHLKQDEREGKGRAGGSYCRVFSTIPTIDEISFEYTYCRGGARGHSTFAAVINGVEFRWKTPLFDYSSTVEKEKPQRSCRNDFVGQWEGNDGRQITTDTIRETGLREGPAGGRREMEGMQREREGDGGGRGAEQEEEEEGKEDQERSEIYSRTNGCKFI